jgi:hypothetical protein
MIVRVYKDGILDLRLLFTKKDLKKMHSYSTKHEGNSIIVQFFDKKGIPLDLKLRKREKT